MANKKDFDKLLTGFLEVASNDLTEVKKINAELQKTVSSLITENISLRDQLLAVNKRLQFHEGLIVQMRSKISQQDEQIIDLKARSMRDNIVIKGVPEAPGEKWEHTKTKLKAFIKNNLKINDENSVQIDRAHQTGAPGKGPRPIVAKLQDQQSRDTVFSNIKNLGRGSPYKVQQQLPTEVVEIRSKLWSKFVAAKADPNNKVSWSLDKLIINGTVYTSQEDKLSIEDANLEDNIDVNHTGHIVMQGSTFMAHSAEVKSRADIATVMANILQDRALASATHNTYAYRFQCEDRMIEGLNDDGEHGAGRQLLKLLQDKTTENAIVVVTRWYGNKHLGPARFTCISEAASTAIDALLA